MSNNADLYQAGVNHLLATLRADPHLKPEFERLKPWASQWLEQKHWLVPRAEWEQLRNDIVHGVVGFGPLEGWLQDETVSEIMVNGFNEVYLEKKGCLKKVAGTFASNEQLRQIINRVVAPLGRRIDESQPMVDARLPDGSRVNAIIEPLSLRGPVLTIRKFPTKPFTLKDLARHGSVNPTVAELLTLLVAHRQNILIAGGTGAGKTSTLNALATLIPPHERVITIEDSAEIRINHPHLISLESRAHNLEGQGAVTIRDLLRNALRMRPDRIVVGEIRGGEAIDMLQAMNTGHEGSITTVHANSPQESLHRLETMVLMGEVALPLEAIRPQIIQGIDWIIQQRRLSGGERKITAVAMVEKSLSGNQYQVKTVVHYDQQQKDFVAVSEAPPLIQMQGSEKLKHWFKKC